MVAALLETSGAFQEDPQDYNVFTIYNVIYNNNK